MFWLSSISRDTTVFLGTTFWSFYFKIEISRVSFGRGAEYLITVIGLAKYTCKKQIKCNTISTEY
jgi:hypothetical protein